MAEVAAYDLPLDPLTYLESLVNKNLLVVSEGPEKEPRFVMLETIHEYAREKLEDMGETSSMQQRHAQYFAALAEQAKPYTRGGPDQIRWLNRLEAERQNIHKALEWSLDGGEIATGLRLVGSLGDFWFRKGHYADGLLWTDRGSIPQILDGATLDIRAGVLHSTGIVAFYSYNHQYAKVVLREAVELYRALDNPRETGYSLAWLAIEYDQPHEHREKLMAMLEESISLLQSVDDQASRTGIQFYWRTCSK